MQIDNHDIWLLKEGEPPALSRDSQKLRTTMLALALAEEGCNVGWFTSSFDHGSKRHLTRKDKTTIRQLAPSARVYLLPGPGYKKNLSLSRIYHQHLTAKAFTRCAAELPKPQLILAAYPTPELCEAARSYAAANNIPFIMDARDPWPDSFLESGNTVKKALLYPLVTYYRKLLSRSAKEAASLVSMSDRMLEWAASYSGREISSQDKVFYLGYRFDRKEELSALEAVTPERFSESEPLQCIFYGMFGNLHNGEVVIRAAKELAARGEKRVQITMAGDGIFRAKWEALAEGLKNIRFTGWLNRTEAEDVLRRSHLGFITISGGVSKYWFGNKFFEYAAHGLAVINDTTSELKDLIESSGIGMNVAPNDSRAIADALQSMLSRPDLLHAMRSASLRRFKREFDSYAIYKRYAEHLMQFIRSEKLLSKKAVNF
ncbi:MAG: glycosyltransferase [Deltaproteobacteria bacterium]|nr:glycosyltransferase [Deltaproteobacteria bacterium]